MNAFRSLITAGHTPRELVGWAAYSLVGLVSGVVATTVIAVGIGTGMSLLVLVIGLPVLWATLVASLWMARHDTGWGARLLGVELVAPARPGNVAGDSMLRGMWSLVRSGYAWRSVLWHVARLLIGTVALALAFALPAGAYSLVVQTFWGVLFDAAVGVRILAIAGAISLLLLIPHSIVALGALHRPLARRLLGATQREQLAQARAQTVAAQTRADLARELHDAVGHSVTAAVLQASAARRTLATDPAQTDQALAAIEERGRAALDELDRVLAVMRDGGAAATDIGDLSGIDQLIDTARLAGQPTTLTSQGDLGAMPAAVSRAAYRVAQEALTNAMRHATGASTHVALTATTGQLHIDIRNEAGATLQPQRVGGGQGLAGLAERVRLMGGTFAAGRTAFGGFEVTADLPYRDADD